MNLRGSFRSLKYSSNHVRVGVWARRILRAFLRQPLRHSWLSNCSVGRSCRASSFVGHTESYTRRRGVRPRVRPSVSQSTGGDASIDTSRFIANAAALSLAPLVTPWRHPTPTSGVAMSIARRSDVMSVNRYTDDEVTPRRSTWLAPGTRQLLYDRTIQATCVQIKPDTRHRNHIEIQTI